MDPYFTPLQKLVLLSHNHYWILLHAHFTTNISITLLPLLELCDLASPQSSWLLESCSGGWECLRRRWWTEWLFHWGWCWHRGGKRQSFENTPSAPEKLLLLYNSSCPRNVLQFTLRIQARVHCAGRRKTSVMGCDCFKAVSAKINN